MSTIRLPIFKHNHAMLNTRGQKAGTEFLQYRFYPRRECGYGLSGCKQQSAAQCGRLPHLGGFQKPMATSQGKHALKKDQWAEE